MLRGGAEGAVLLGCWLPGSCCWEFPEPGPHQGGKENKKRVQVEEEKARRDSTAGSERGGNRGMLKRAPGQGFMEGGQALQLGTLTPLPLELGARDASS